MFSAARNKCIRDTRGIRARASRLTILGSPGATKDEIQEYEPTEEERGEYHQKPYDAQQEIKSLQNPQPFVPFLISKERVGTAGFEPATTRPPAECAT